MNKDETAGSAAQITGMPRPGTFERACYAVHNHGDGTGTVALDWCEMSDGRDYFGSHDFMRAEINRARQVAALLNKQLPGRVLSVPTELDWSNPLADG
jgi:hypothetical protein